MVTFKNNKKMKKLIYAMMLLCFSVAVKAQDYALEQVASIATENLIGKSSP